MKKEGRKKQARSNKEGRKKEASKVKQGRKEERSKQGQTNNKVMQHRQSLSKVKNELPQHVHVYVCLSGLWLGGLLYLSFLFYFFKLLC